MIVLGYLSYDKAKSTIEKNANGNQQTIIQTSEKIDIILEKYENAGRQIFYDIELQKLLSEYTDKKLSDYDAFTVERAFGINYQSDNIGFVDPSHLFDPYQG